MARITIPDQGARLEDPREISRFLERFGIWYERWESTGRVGQDTSADEILAAYAAEVKELKQRGGYVTADVIDVNPETPGLEAMLDRFNKEHTHSEDEVRFVVGGRGVFHIHPDGEPVFAIELEAGDMINVPAGTKHWFDLCAERTIRTIRLFQDSSGWTPHYVDNGIHGRYIPVCFGPQDIDSDKRIKPAIKL